MGILVITRVKSTKIQENKPPFLLSVFQILPKATKLSLFWCFLPENSTRGFWLESLIYVGVSVDFFNRKIIILKGLLKIAFLLEKEY
ncbi:hypothetical protein BJM32_13115 [Listeria monocytogenes]|nr:hypothetical protein [Listeria monocytogenes]EAD8851320.1 hypothetical protein [Listeria monocytogenes]OFF47413.1 hypothetical protein BJM32_13115 [Listeria monocytogenes]